jgi:hypothetical protein
MLVEDPHAEAAVVRPPFTEPYCYSDMTGFALCNAASPVPAG